MDKYDERYLSIYIIKTELGRLPRKRKKQIKKKLKPTIELLYKIIDECWEWALSTETLELLFDIKNNL